MRRENTRFTPPSARGSKGRNSSRCSWIDASTLVACSRREGDAPGPRTPYRQRGRRSGAARRRRGTTGAGRPSPKRGRRGQAKDGAGTRARPRGGDLRAGWASRGERTVGDAGPARVRLGPERRPPRCVAGSGLAQAFRLGRGAGGVGGTRAALLPHAGGRRAWGAVGLQLLEALRVLVRRAVDPGGGLVHPGARARAPADRTRAGGRARAPRRPHVDPGPAGTTGRRQRNPTRAHARRSPRSSNGGSPQRPGAGLATGYIGPSFLDRATHPSS